MEWKGLVLPALLPTAQQDPYLAQALKVRIPRNLDTHSRRSWVPIPEQAGQLEHSDAEFLSFTLRGGGWVNFFGFSYPDGLEVLLLRNAGCWKYSAHSAVSNSSVATT